MWRDLVTTAIPWLVMPVTACYGYWGYHKHLFGIFKEEERLAYNKEKIPFDDRTQGVIDELMRYITEKWRPLHVAGVRWFWSNTSEPTIRGSTATRQGSLVGVPYRFSYQTIDDIDPGKVTLLGEKEVDWKSDDAEKLLNSLVLTDSAKKYALARELHFLNSNYVHVNALAGIIFGYTGLWCVYKTNRSNMLHYDKTKLGFRVGMYLIIGYSMVLLYREFLRSYNKTLHLRSDMHAVTMGKDYALGGIEYYDKLIKQNKALRRLGGKDAEQRFTEKGDEKKGYFNYDIPVTSHLKNVMIHSRRLYATEEDNTLKEIVDRMLET